MVNREIRQAASMDKGVTDTVNVSDTAGPPNTPFIIGLINQKVTANPPRPHKTPRGILIRAMTAPQKHRVSFLFLVTPGEHPK